MTKISSTLTSLGKVVLPFVWLAMGALVAVVSAVIGPADESLVDLVPMGIFVGLTFALMKLLSWSLADEVYDGGDFLLIKNHGKEERVPFSNIRSVRVTTLRSPQKITLSLIEPGRFGSQIKFLARRNLSFAPFAPNAIAADLSVRVCGARPSGLPWLLR